MSRWPTVAKHLAARLARQTLRRKDDFGGADERVAPQRHRHRAGMSRLTQEFDVEISLPGNRGDHAERLVAVLEHRPLFDMHLDIGRGYVARESSRGNIGDTLAVCGISRRRQA